MKKEIKQFIIDTFPVWVAILLFLVVIISSLHYSTTTINESGRTWDDFVAEQTKMVNEDVKNMMIKENQILNKERQDRIAFCEVHLPETLSYEDFKVCNSLQQ